MMIAKCLSRPTNNLTTLRSEVAAWQSDSDDVNAKIAVHKRQRLRHTQTALSEPADRDHPGTEHDGVTAAGPPTQAQPYCCPPLEGLSKTTPHQ